LLFERHSERTEGKRGRESEKKKKLSKEAEKKVCVVIPQRITIKERAR
jgi:hypothetical protein